MEQFAAWFLSGLIFVGGPCYLLGIKKGIRIRIEVERAMQEHIDIQKTFLKENREIIRRLHDELSAAKYGGLTDPTHQRPALLH